MRKVATTPIEAEVHLVPERALAAIQPVAMRVVLADDHAAMRRSIRLLLDDEDGIEVVAEAADLATVGRDVRDYRPDILILDLRIGSCSSIGAIRELGERYPATEILVLTMEASPGFAQHALAAGAIGYVLKELADTDLVVALRRARVGVRFVSAPVDSPARVPSLSSAATSGPR